MENKPSNTKSYRLSPVHLNAFTKTRLRFRSPLHLLHDPLNMIPRDAVEKHGCWTQCATAFFRLAPHNFHIQLSGSLKHPRGSAPTNSHKCKLKNGADRVWWRTQEQAEAGTSPLLQCLQEGKSIVRMIQGKTRSLDEMFTRLKFYMVISDSPNLLLGIRMLESQVWDCVC